MPAYNFKLAFAHDVEIGVKHQTIRLNRKYPTKKGDKLSLYTGMRTKRCRLLKRAECTSVVPVEIHDTYVTVDGERLHRDDIKALALADGFLSSAMFVSFFEKQYGLPFKGVLIKW